MTFSLVSVLAKIALEGISLFSCFVDPEKIEKRLNVKLDIRLRKFAVRTLDVLALYDSLQALEGKTDNTSNKWRVHYLKKIKAETKKLKNYAKRLII